MFSNLAFILFFPIFSFSSIINGANIEKLPFCKENSESTLVLVSTIDGKLSAVSSEGNLLWQINTDPGPLLTSNIHNLELTNNGRWVRIIPSLSGTLYRFDGNTIDPIPITAESLLKSSFKYSDDLVIAGGMEVWTYGVGLRTGKVFYICSTSKCKNKPDHNNNDNDDVLLIERNSQTVRAIDPQSGQERWNFSVGHHNIKLTQTTCRNPNANLFDWNITAVIPDGLLLASSFNNNVEITWQYHFPSPIVRIWKWNGIEFNEIDLFSMKNLFATTSESQVFPAIYIGMHNKQLYIHESNIFQHLKSSNINVISDTKIPWKPISASGILTEDDSTALSILYNSEYVNGNGYYLFTEFDLKQKNSNFCGKNYTIKITQLIQDDIFKTTLKLWWKEICLITFTTMIVLNLMLKTFAYRNNNSQEKKKKQQLIINENNKNSDNSKLSSSMNCDTNTFNSRYLNDFETVKCLGKGGFGVVFEVKQKIDECHYAIKRIILPNENKKRDAVMREVKALAKLEHNNIVRYFNSWVEYPPLGWNREYDNQWLVQDEMTTMSYDNTTTTTTTTTTTNNDNYNNELLITTKSQQDDDSFIVFKNDLSDTVISSNNNGGNGGDGGDGGDGRGGGGGRCRGGGRGRGGDRGRSGGDGDRRSLSTNFSTNTYKQDQQTPPVFLYIQMQLCQECSLRDWLMKNNQRDSDKILDIFKQIVAAVEYVHLRGLIHRDLKPSNIFFSLDGQIKIGDFGLVKDIEDAYDNVIYNFSPIKSHTKNVGTRLYMSPEQLNGKQYNYKVDIYSLGLIFFELLVHFTTDMERIVTLNKIKENDYPGNFLKKHPKEHELLTMMLSKLPEKRLTTFGIRARPPISDNKCNLYDYELPTLLKNSSLPSSLLSSSSFSSSKT